MGGYIKKKIVYKSRYIQTLESMIYFFFFHSQRVNNCERSELSGLFNAWIFYIYNMFIYIFQAVRRAVNVLNVSTCI